MVWTAPQTWTTGQVVTAADMNGDVRDNMLETAAARATAAGDLIYADAVKSMGSRLAHPGQSRLLVSAASSGLVWRQPVSASNYALGATSGSFSHTTYELGGGGANETAEQFPSVTVTTGTLAVVAFGCRFAEHNTAGEAVDMSYTITGATSSAATASRSTRGVASDPGYDFSLGRTVLQSLTAGSNTFSVAAFTSGGTATINGPYIIVIPL